MSYTLYTAPDCLRCKIVKAFMGVHDIGCEQFDFKADKDIFNAFYRANRSSIYRNPEGVEFPLLHDSGNDVIRQGSGEIIAYFLAGRGLEACVTRSHLLHGWISGLHVSSCPQALTEHFTTLIRALAQGGLLVCLETDGRRPDLLETVLAEGLAARVILNIPGPADVYPSTVGGTLAPEDLKKSIALIRGHPAAVIRLLVGPLTPPDAALALLTPAQAGEAARMVLEACGDMQLPFTVQWADAAQGLTPLDQGGLLPYRSRVRNHLVKAEIFRQ